MHTTTTFTPSGTADVRTSIGENFAQQKTEKIMSKIEITATLNDGRQSKPEWGTLAVVQKKATVKGVKNVAVDRAEWGIGDIRGKGHDGGIVMTNVMFGLLDSLTFGEITVPIAGNADAAGDEPRRSVLVAPSTCDAGNVTVTVRPYWTVGGKGQHVLHLGINVDADSRVAGIGDDGFK